ncbi:hypothetical protein [Halobacterium hubeiense]|uniref:hypothetical protein n=1 Tax=Halobacterium hubeiense TaxID=1407499 RepID=UPI003C719CF3
MRRRALLSSLAATTAALAGCASTAGDDATTTEPSERTTTRDPTTTGEPPGEDERPASYASVVELETGPRTYSFAPTGLNTDDGANVALWFDRTATAEHPARLRGFLENANSYANTFEVEWIPVVGRTHGRQPDGYDHEASLHFAPTENNDLAEAVPEVVRDDTGYWRVADLGPWVVERKRLAPGERVELEYVLVGEPGLPGRPTGTYEFRGRDADARVTVWNAERPGPDGESRFAGRSLPALSEETTVQWFHDADESTTAYLRPERERAELDGRVAFEMVHNGREAASCGHWNLHKLVDGEWFHVGPNVHTSDCRALYPGGRTEWDLRAFNGVPVGCDCETFSCGSGLTRGFLGGGEYAVVVGYGDPTDESAALVELVGDPVEIVPTEDAEIAVDGDEATVTVDSYGDGERPADASFALTRAERADERLIPEQVMGETAFQDAGGGLRNALAAMREDVDRAVVRADDHVVDAALGYDADVRRFETRGQAYEATRVEGE